MLDDVSALQTELIELAQNLSEEDLRELVDLANDLHELRAAIRTTETEFPLVEYKTFQCKTAEQIGLPNFEIGGE